MLASSALVALVVANVGRREAVPAAAAGLSALAVLGALRRSRTDRVFAGVCGGMGHYFRIDPIILRIVMVALIFAGVGLIAYLIAWIAIPKAGGAGHRVGQMIMRVLSGSQTERRPAVEPTHESARNWPDSGAL